MLQWKTGVWTPGTVKPLVWTRKAFGPVRKLVPTLDFQLFERSVHAAFVANSALTYSTEALCRLSTLTVLVYS